MAFVPVAWSSSLAVLSGILKPLRRGGRRPAQPQPPAAALAPVPAPQPGRHAIQLPQPAPVLPDLVALAASVRTCAARSCASNRPAAAKPPLRVFLREQEGGAGRLLISGRMADVCAELDRLVLH